MAETQALPAPSNFKIIGLVSGGHFFSHFYSLLLPPLFPLLKAEFGVSYAALGLIVTVFSLSSGIGQTPIGFLVDKIGARWILLAGLVVQGLAIMMMGLTGSYMSLLIFYAIAGLANTVYHPADYSILSANVAPERLGRAFSLHTFSGNVGWAIAPAYMVAISALWDWRAGLILSGIGGLIMAVVLWSQSNSLRDERDGLREKKDSAPDSNESSGKSAASVGGGIALLFSPPILMAFIFFMLIAIGFGAIRTFSVAALVAIYGTPLAVANGALTGFLVGSAAGILIGGVAADRFKKPERSAAIGFIGGAALLILLGSVSVPIAAMVALLTVAGLFNGYVQPSRDLLVRSVTPEGATGKVFGFVSTGLNVGTAIMPLIFGWIMDNADPRWVFWLAGGIVLSTLLTVGGLGRFRREAVRASNSSP